MKREIVGVFVCMLLIATAIPLSLATNENEPKDSPWTMSCGATGEITTPGSEEESMTRTSLWGLVSNVKEVSLYKVSAEAVYLSYHIKSDHHINGIVTGGTKVQFKDGPLVIITKPRLTGLSFVFGMFFGEIEVG